MSLVSHVAVIKTHSSAVCRYLTAAQMLRLVLRLRPSARISCPRVLPAGPGAAGRSVPGTVCLRRLHRSAASRAACLGSGAGHRAALLRCPQLAGVGQTQRFYSLPPHQKVTSVSGDS